LRRGMETKGESKGPEDVSLANADSGSFNDEPLA